MRMKALYKLSLFIFTIMYFSQAYSNFQSHKDQFFLSDIKICKNYVGLERLCFSDNGIFLRDNKDQWLPINELHYDSQGYYLTGILDILFPKA